MSSGSHASITFELSVQWCPSKCVTLTGICSASPQTSVRLQGKSLYGGGMVKTLSKTYLEVMKKEMKFGIL
jgi:hypothetical protein